MDGSREEKQNRLLVQSAAALIGISLKRNKLMKAKFDFEEEIFGEPDPFLTIGKVIIGLIITGFIILSLQIILEKEQMKMREAERALQTN